MFRRQVTPGMELKQFEMGDAEAIFAVVERNREYLREWLPWVDHTRSVEDVRQFISRTIAQFDANQGPQTGVWIDGAPCGSLGVHPIDWPNRKCSIGYWIDRAQQGKGVMTRCCVTMLDYLFGELGLNRVAIHCATGNTRSCAIPQRLGFTREGVARNGEWVNDRWVDMAVWGMLEREWRDSAVLRRDG